MGYRRAWELIALRDDTYHAFEVPTEVCGGWGDQHPCPAEGRTVFRRQARWTRNGKTYCGTCKRLDEAWRAGTTVKTKGLDPEIRAALVEHLAPTPVRHEVISYSATIDVLALSPTSMEAFEIKSDSDSVRRLPQQVAGYDLVSPRSWLAVGSRHHTKAKAMLPDHWGVLVHDGDALHVDREAADNPHLSLPHLIRMVTTRQTLVEAARRAAPLGRPVRTLDVFQLRDHIATHMPRDEVIAEVSAYLAKRVPR